MSAGDVCDANAVEISLSGAFILMSTSSGLVSACLCHISRDLVEVLTVIQIRSTNQQNALEGWVSKWEQGKVF